MKKSQGFFIVQDFYNKLVMKNYEDLKGIAFRINLVSGIKIFADLPENNVGDVLLPFY
jgi:hypothetical protein